MLVIIAGHAITHTDVLDALGGINYYSVKLLGIVFNVATNVYVLIRIFVV